MAAVVLREHRVHAPGHRVDLPRQRVHVGRSDLRQLAPAQYGLDRRVRLPQRLEGVRVRRPAPRRLARPGQRQLLEEHVRELLRRADLELVPDRREHLGPAPPRTAPPVPRRGSRAPRGPRRGRNCSMRASTGRCGRSISRKTPSRSFAASSGSRSPARRSVASAAPAAKFAASSGSVREKGIALRPVPSRLFASGSSCPSRSKASPRMSRARSPSTYAATEVSKSMRSVQTPPGVSASASI